LANFALQNQIWQIGANGRQETVAMAANLDLRRFAFQKLARIRQNLRKNAFHLRKERLYF